MTLKSYKYIKENDIVSIARETRDTRGLTYDIWSSRTREWRPSETAAGVFVGFEDGIWVNISEQKAREIIRRYESNLTIAAKRANQNAAGTTAFTFSKPDRKSAMQKACIEAVSPLKGGTTQTKNKLLRRVPPSTSH